MDAKTRLNNGKRRVVLVLQGGGALGSYQAGVYEAMHEHGLTPDWVVGTSIGAINAAIIAGNEHHTCLSRLRTFWDTVAQEDLLDMRKVPDPVRRLNSRLTAFNCIFNGVQGFYSPRWFNPFFFGIPVPAESASFYDTSELRHTLEQLVNFRHLNSGKSMRLTVNAMSVVCGLLEHFDNRSQKICTEHVLASGALPPSFPPVRINGTLYWDGGLYSNTPLETVLKEEPRVDTLCFMVDLWSAEGPEPLTFDQVQTRQKDVTYASRSKRHIEAYLRGHKLRQLIRSLREKVPEDQLSAEDKRALEEIGAETTMHIVRLAYSGRDWQMALKDTNFSRGSIEWRWEQGYKDALRAIEVSAWHAEVPEGAGLVVHEFGPESICEEPRQAAYGATATASSTIENRRSQSSDLSEG